MLSKKTTAAVAIGFVALLSTTALVLLPGIYGPFLFDDIPNFENLRHLNGKLNRHAIGTYLSLFGGMPGRPISALSFLLNDFAWPSDPIGFKLTNLLIHLLNGCLAFGLARTLARAQTWPKADAIALLCAAIWLLNPVQISAIFLTVQRMTLLSGLFVLAGLWGYVVLALRTRSAVGALLSIVVLGTGTLLAYLSKENGALAVLYAAVINATLLNSSLSKLQPITRNILRGTPWLAFFALIIAVASQWSSVADFSTRPFTLVERLLTEGRVLSTYIGRVFIPKLSSSSIYNDDYAISTGLLSPPTTLVGLVFLATMLVFALGMRRRFPLVSFAILWYLAGHALESTVLSLELYFEHRNYMPLFGIAFALASSIQHVRGKLRVPVVAGLVAWLALGAGISHLQARVWGNWAMLSTIWRSENPNSLRAQQQYADFLYRTGQIEEARQVFVENLERGLAVGDSRLQIAVIDCRFDRKSAGTDLAHIEQYLATGRLNIGTAATLAAFRPSIESGQCSESVPATRWLDWTRLALANPTAAGLQRMLRMERSYYYVGHRRLDLATKEWDAAWRIDAEPRIAFYAAAILATDKQFDAAEQWAERPLKQKGPWWNRWLAQTDDEARSMLHAIRQSRQAELERNLRDAHQAEAGAATTRQ